jgi:hypothetical protein
LGKCHTIKAEVLLEINLALAGKAFTSVVVDVTSFKHGPGAATSGNGVAAATVATVGKTIHAGSVIVDGMGIIADSNVVLFVLFETAVSEEVVGINTSAGSDVPVSSGVVSSDADLDVTAGAEVVGVVTDGIVTTGVVSTGVVTTGVVSAGGVTTGVVTTGAVIGGIVISSEESSSTTAVQTAPVLATVV